MEAAGFEPARANTMVLKTTALDHSAMLPKVTSSIFNIKT